MGGEEDVEGGKVVNTSSNLYTPDSVIMNQTIEVDCPKKFDHKDHKKKVDYLKKFDHEDHNHRS